MSGQERIREAFLVQAGACEKLDSPFMGQLFRLLHKRLDQSTAAGEKALNWSGDPSPSGDSVPLRLAGALRALVLSGKDRQLAAAYPPNIVADAQLWTAIGDALTVHSGFVLAWMNSPPQTNEVRRSGALYPGLCVAAELAGNAELTVMELGSSAGLNLICDAYGYRLDGKSYGNANAGLVIEPKWHGEAPPRDGLRMVRRIGCDINPLNVNDDNDRLRMRSYVWADQADRLDRMDKAIGIAASADAPFDLERADAETWLRRNLLDEPVRGARAIMHSIAWQYFPQATQVACRTIIEQAGANATSGAPLFWLAMEADGAGRGAGLTLRNWPGGEERLLARVDFHGRWIDWRR